MGFEAQPVEYLGVYKMKRKDVDNRATGNRIVNEEKLSRSFLYLFGLSGWDKCNR